MVRTLVLPQSFGDQSLAQIHRMQLGQSNESVTILTLANRTLTLRGAATTFAVGHAVVFILRDHGSHHVGTAMQQLFGLTNREAEIVELFAKGLGQDECAHHLGLSKHTSRTHLKRIMTKTGATNQRQLLTLRRSLGQVEME